MRALTDQEKQAVQKFTEFIVAEVDLETLATELDGVIWTCSVYLIEDKENPGFRGRSSGLYYLRELRNICFGKEDN